MSILIKGIDIPKENSIIIEIDEDGEVYEHITGGQPVHIKPWVKAIQIPTPHGRLIDGDGLCNEFSNRCPGDCGCCGESRDDIYDCGLIINAPTILEEEKQ